MSSVANRQAAVMHRVDVHRAPNESAFCRVPGCAGVLRFYTIEFGRVVDVCDTCARRVALAKAVELQLRAEVARLTARIVELEAML